MKHKTIKDKRGNTTYIYKQGYTYDPKTQNTKNIGKRENIGKIIQDEDGHETFYTNVPKDLLRDKDFIALIDKYRDRSSDSESFKAFLKDNYSIFIESPGTIESILQRQHQIYRSHKPFNYKSQDPPYKVILLRDDFFYIRGENQQGFMNIKLSEFMTRHNFTHHFPCRVFINPTYINKGLLSKLEERSETKLICYEILPKQDLSLFDIPDSKYNYRIRETMEKQDIYLEALDTFITTHDTLFPSEIEELVDIFNIYFKTIKTEIDSDKIYVPLDILNKHFELD